MHFNDSEAHVYGAFLTKKKEQDTLGSVRQSNHVHARRFLNQSHHELEQGNVNVINLMCPFAETHFNVPDIRFSDWHLLQKLPGTRTLHLKPHTEPMHASCQ